jgi:hypothetical protein
VCYGDSFQYAIFWDITHVSLTKHECCKSEMGCLASLASSGWHYLQT